MQTIKKLLDMCRAEEDVAMHVLPVTHGGFGVYANKLLLAIHTDLVAAEAHCLRLRNQQAADMES